MIPWAPHNSAELALSIKGEPWEGSIVGILGGPAQASESGAPAGPFLIA